MLSEAILHKKGVIVKIIADPVVLFLNDPGLGLVLSIFGIHCKCDVHHNRHLEGMEVLCLDLGCNLVSIVLSKIHMRENNVIRQ
jgi:hypothetical protein